MTPTDPRDAAHMSALQALLQEAAGRARALAFAMAHVAGLDDEAERETFIAEALAPYWRAPPPARARREAPREALREEEADGRRPQELVVDILRELEGEATIPQLLNVLDDMGHQISANHLSVLLTRLAQSGVIERVGRGRYRAR